MPMRYLKPEYRDSDTINALSDAAEALWCRLLVTVDDYGRFDGRPSLVKSQCYPVKESVTAAHCDQLLRELDAKGAIVVFLVGGKPYLQMQKWTNTPRAAKSKFPEFVSDCERVYAGPGAPLPPASPPAKAKRGPKASPNVEELPPGFARFWAAWPRSTRKEARGKCVEVWLRCEFEPIAEKIVEHVVAMCATPQWRKNDGEFIPAPLVYLNNRRWEGFEDGGRAPTDDAWVGGV